MQPARGTAVPAVSSARAGGRALVLQRKALPSAAVMAAFISLSVAQQLLFQAA